MENRAHQTFRATAQRILRNQPHCLDELNQVLNLHATQSSASEGEPPFIFVEGSSGSGKTQFAMTIMEAKPDGRDVFYLVATNVTSQSIYQAYAFPSNAYRKCVRNDLASAAFEQEEDRATSMKVGMLANLPCFSFGVLRHLLRNGYTGSCQIIPCMAAEVLAGHQGPAPILILDEFHPGRGVDNDLFRLMRYVARAAGFHLIVTGTNTTASNMTSFDKYESRQGEPSPWCTVIDVLPKFVLDDGVKAVHVPPLLRQILLHSRPWFAYLLFTEWEKDPEMPLDTDHLLALCAEAGSTVWDRKRLSRYLDGLHGQICLFVAANYIEEWDTIDSKHHFSTTIHRHFAKLYHSKQMGSGPIYLNQFGKFVRLVKGELRWNRAMEWIPRSLMPSPSTDLLLHFLLGGIPGVPPFRIEEEMEISIAEVVSKLHRDSVTRKYKLDGRNPVQITNDGTEFELIATATVCVASRRRGFGGSSVLAFLDELLYQWTEMPNEPKPRRKVSPFQRLVRNHPFLAKVRVPFLPPPNQEWPDFVHEISGSLFGDLTRTSNSDRVDFQFWSDTDYFSAECKDYGRAIPKDTMIGILERISAKMQPKLHLVFCNKLQQNYFDGKKEHFDAALDAGNTSKGKKGTVDITAAANKAFVKSSCAFYRIAVDAEGSKLERVKGLWNALEPKCVVIFFERNTRTPCPT